MVLSCPLSLTVGARKPFLRVLMCVLFPQASLLWLYPVAVKLPELLR